MITPFEPAPTYHVELFYRAKPKLKKAQLLAELRKHCEGIEPLDPKDKSLLAFVHTKHRITYAEGETPAQAFIAESEHAPDVNRLAEAIQQSWKLDDAEAVVTSCKHTLLVTDLMASGLDYQTRFDLFQRVLRAVVTIAPCEAIHFVHAQQIMSCADFLKHQDGSLVDQLTAGPLNVRYYRIEDSDGAMLMDTRGLSAFGLPDLQCHFYELDRQDIAWVLYNTAYYIFEQGDVIEDGQTVPGIEPDSIWVCQHEDALAGPERCVLDLNPGSPFAAGNR